LATANAWKALYREAQSIELTLGPPTDSDFLVLDPEGGPVDGATVDGATVEPREVKTPVGLTLSSPPQFILPTL
jgi:hypothetical protein